MEDSKLLARYGDLHPGKDRTRFNVLDLLHSEGSPLDALLYSRLFWPEFVEYDAMVFLKETIEDASDVARLREALAGYSNDRSQTEKSFNFIDVGDLFGPLAGETDAELDESLAHRLRDMWQARLVALFPNRSFTVQVVPPEDSGGSVGLIFWQNR
jgi:hypothetical protein